MDHSTADRRRFYKEIGVTLYDRVDRDQRHLIEPESRTQQESFGPECSIATPGPSLSSAEIYDVCPDGTGADDSDVSTEAMTTPEFWDALEEKQPIPPDGTRAFFPESVDAPTDSVIAEVQGGYHIGRESPNHLNLSLDDFDGAKMPLRHCQPLPCIVAGEGKGVTGVKTECGAKKGSMKDVLPSRKQHTIENPVGNPFSSSAGLGTERKAQAHSFTAASDLGSASSQKRKSSPTSVCELRRSKRLKEQAQAWELTYTTING